MTILYVQARMLAQGVQGVQCTRALRCGWPRGTLCGEEGGPCGILAHGTRSNLATPLLKFITVFHVICHHNNCVRMSI